MKKERKKYCIAKNSLQNNSLQPKGQSTAQPTIQSTVRSNDTYIYGVGMLAVLAVGVYVIFAYNTFQPKKIISEKQDQPPKRFHIFKKPM